MKIFFFCITFWLWLGVANALRHWQIGSVKNSLENLRWEDEIIIGGKAKYVRQDYLVAWYYIDLILAGAYGFFLKFK